MAHWDMLELDYPEEQLTINPCSHEQGKGKVYLAMSLT